jgi:drug/metabolite transporter (DMT)-like permease
MIVPPSARERRLALAAWIAVCVIWGTTYLGIRVALETVPPAVMASLRWIAAAAILVAFMRVRREPLPPVERWGGIALMGFLLLFVGNGGVVYAQQWVPSGLAAVLVATAPFWMAGVERAAGTSERFHLRTLIGLLVGFVGIVVLVWPELSVKSADSRRFLIGVALLQLAAFGWSLGSAYSRRFARQDHVVGTTALQMLAGGLFLGVLALLRGEWMHVAFNGRTAAALIYLATVGSIGGFLAYTYALRHLPVSLVSLYAYINPVIAVALGVLLLGEPFDARIAAAASLVLVGVAVVRSASGAVPPPAAAAADVADDTSR